MKGVKKFGWRGRATLFLGRGLNATGSMRTNIQKSSQIPYSYPIRMSSVIVIFRIIAAQFLIGFTSLLITLPLVAFKETIDVYIPIIILYALIILVLQCFNMISLVIIFLNWLNTIYIIRPDEIVVQKGILHIRENIYPTKRVEEVIVDQGFVGRVFNYGSINVYSPTYKDELVLQDIAQPYTYADVIRRSESKENILFVKEKTEKQL